MSGAVRYGEAERGEAGFALLIVLWTLVLLALLVTALTAAGQGEARLAANLRAGATAEAAADGAIFEAIFHVMDASPRHWYPDGTVRPLHFARAVIDVRLVSEAGKINPNTAPVALLQALLQAVGANVMTAPSLAAAIADWRFPSAQPRPLGAKSPQYLAAGRSYGPPNAPFESLDELGGVLGMTPQLLALLRPHLSLYQEAPPDPAFADPVVAQALNAAGPLPPGGVGVATAQVVMITALAVTADGARFGRRAIVRIGARANGSLYRIMTWDRSDEPRGG